MRDERKTKKQLIAELVALRREGEIQQGLETVRTQVAAMRSSQDIYRVRSGVEDGLRHLGVRLDVVAVWIGDPEARTALPYDGHTDQPRPQWLPPSVPPADSYWQHWQN